MLDKKSLDNLHPIGERLTMASCIVAMGGGFAMERLDSAMDDYVLGLAKRPKPRISFIAAAGGDAPAATLRFYQAFAPRRCTPTVLPLFAPQHADLRSVVLSQDIIYVGGGNTVNLVAVLRAHGMDLILREAWQTGVVLCGVSAGALCWFSSGLTDSFAPDLRPFDSPLAMLPGSLCPHYNSDTRRRPTYGNLVGTSRLSAGWGLDDGAAMRFSGTEVAEVVSTVDDATAWRVEATSPGAARATALATTRLPPPR